MLAVANFEFDEETLSEPVLPLTEKVTLLKFVEVPLVAESFKVPLALFIFVVSVITLVVYPALLALTVTVNDETFVIVGIVVLYVPPFIEYSIFASLGFALTFVNALCAFPSYVPLYGVALKLIVPLFTVAVYVADFAV